MHSAYIILNNFKTKKHYDLFKCILFQFIFNILVSLPYAPTPALLLNKKLLYFYYLR